MQVVSEGLESEEHFKMLKDFKSDYGQGYYYEKALAPARADAYIKEHFS
jgi:EAL domain-containing protein (putative c-di-GMP-specific phosphodiesterase class I)